MNNGRWTFRFAVEGKPIGKGRPQVVRRGNKVWAITPGRTREYEETIRKVFNAFYPGSLPIDGPVTLIIHVFVKNPESRPDASNIAKAIEDALNGLAYRDDSQIVRLVIEKYKLDEVFTEEQVHIHVEKGRVG